MMSAPGTWTMLADAAWRVTFILLTAWAVVILLRRRPAAVRHGVWALAIVAALAVPLASGVVPRWRLAVLPAAAALIPGAGTDHAPSRPMAMSPINDLDLAPVTPNVAPTLKAGPDETASGAPAATAAVRARAVDWLGLGWVTIAAMVLGRYLASVASVRWLLRQAEPVEDERWRDAADVAAAELGLRETPPLVASPGVTVPFTAGLFRAVVAVPATAVAHWTDERIRVVLLHELAHVRRRDCLMQAVTQVACAVYWFNPLTWVAARRLRAERERACDDLVLSAGLRGAEYAQHLLDIARVATSRRALSAAALAMARPSELEGRLLAILDSRPVIGLRAAGASWRGVALAAAAVLALASVHPVAREFTATADEAAARVTPEAPVVTADDDQPAATPAPTPTPAPSPAPAPAPTVRVLTVQSGQIAATISQSVAAKGKVIAESVADDVIDGVEAAIEQASQTPRADSDGEATRKSRTVSPAVLQGLTDAMKDTDADVRKQALQALTRLGVPVAFDTLVASVKDPDADIREHAAFALGRTKDPRAVAPLTAALQDEDADVREQAVFALSQLRSAEAVPALRKALSDASPDVREQAVIALWQLRDPASVPAFMQALKDEDADVREQAVFALSQLGDRSALPALLQALANDPSDDVREQAAFALSQIGDESAVAGLTAALKDKSADVRQQAVFALSQIAEGDTRPRARRAESVKPAIAPMAVKPQ
jgi:HEAT repeat protein/beta-lactamase regulating signal transducer with metallopeptidase domain